KCYQRDVATRTQPVLHRGLLHLIVFNQPREPRDARCKHRTESFEPQARTLHERPATFSDTAEHMQLKEALVYKTLRPGCIVLFTAALGMAGASRADERRSKAAADETQQPPAPPPAPQPAQSSPNTPLPEEAAEAEHRRAMQNEIDRPKL